MYPEIVISIFGVMIKLDTYPLFAGLAVVAALALSVVLLRKIGWKIWQTLILFLTCALFFLIGARLLNFAINYDNYIKEEYSVFELSFGHFSVYGGMAAACLPPLILVKAFKKDIWKLCDTMVFPFILAFAIMRVGCFLNGCCYGKVSDALWAVRAPNALTYAHEKVNSLLPSIIKSNASLTVYPTQLMEMGFALIFIPLGIWLYKKFPGRGVVLFVFASYFSAFRLLVLLFRDLPYSDVVVNVLYPVVYGAVFILGVVMACYRLQSRIRVSQ